MVQVVLSEDSRAFFHKCPGVDKYGPIVYTCAVELEKKIRGRTARIGMIGLGYVGLPLAVEFARAGFPVTAVESDPHRLATLRRGQSYVSDVSNVAIKRVLRGRRMEIHGDSRGLSHCDVVIICVQTPLRKSKEPDLGAVVAACGQAAKRLRKGQLVVLESTTYPGTTEAVVLPILEASGLKAGRDFFLAFSPERVDPGNAQWKIANTPKVVGAIDPASTKAACALYEQIVHEVVRVSSTSAAELVKLLENSFRAVNIALVNEMAQICQTLGLDVWEIVNAAATKPFGFMPFCPGPGIGGHCIPKDPQLLTWKMKKLNYRPRLIELATAINASMPGYTVSRIIRALNRDGKKIKGSHIFVLGVAYKAGVSDCRESPALDVMHLLADLGATVDYHDVHVPTASVAGRTWRGRPLTDAALKAADLVVTLTAHPGVDYKRVCRLARRVFDARNVTAGLSGRIERL